MLKESERGYFQPEQAREVADAFARHGVDFLFIGKGAAVDIAVERTRSDAQ